MSRPARYVTVTYLTEGREHNRNAYKNALSVIIPRLGTERLFPTISSEIRCTAPELLLVTDIFDIHFK